MALFTFSSPGGDSVSPIIHQLFGRIFPLPFIAAGIIFIWLGWRDIQLARASATWPSVPGQIESVDGSSDRVTYCYQILSVDRANSTVYFGDHTDSFKKASDRSVNQYIQGQAVTVYYNPLNPAYAVLRPGVDPFCYFFPVVGSAFVISGIMIFIFLPSYLEKRRAKDALTV